MKNDQKGQIIRADHGLIAILTVLSAVSVMVKVRLGFDIDEQYAFSMMYRFSEGQKYLTDLFDPHQFSAFLMTPLFLLCRNLRICWRLFPKTSQFL